MIRATLYLCLALIAEALRTPDGSEAREGFEDSDGWHAGREPFERGEE